MSSGFVKTSVLKVGGGDGVRLNIEPRLLVYLKLLCGSVFPLQSFHGEEERLETEEVRRQTFALKQAVSRTLTCAWNTIDSHRILIDD